MYTILSFTRELCGNLDVLLAISTMGPLPEPTNVFSAGGALSGKRRVPLPLWDEDEDENQDEDEERGKKKREKKGVSYKWQGRSNSS